MKNSPILENLSVDIQEEFTNNLLSVLVYGSVIRGEDNSDLDLIVILRRKEDCGSDIKKLSNIIDTNSNEKFDMQLFYENEIMNSKLFSLDAHGSFFLEILKNAYPLFGSNPFISLQLEEEERQRGALNKIQNYIFRVRQEAMGLGRHSKDSNPLYHKKKILRVIDDILIFDGDFEDGSNNLETFLKSYPEILSKTEISKIIGDTAYQLQDYLEIYEKLYSFIIKKANKHIPSIVVKPQKIKIKNVISEYIDVEESKSCVILLEGLPSIPDGKKIMNIFSNQGFSVFYPRYVGTWESEGQFLKKSPVEEIEDIIDSLINGIKLNDKVRKFKEIYVVATSFGGSIALTLRNRPEIKQILALSPVCEYDKIESLSTLSEYLKIAFPGSYRYMEEDWQNLLKGELISPARNLENFSERDKITIFGGVEDPQISINQLKNFSQKYRIKFYRFDKKGHLSFSKLSGNVLEEALKLLNCL